MPLDDLLMPVELINERTIEKLRTELIAGVRDARCALERGEAKRREDKREFF